MTFGNLILYIGFILISIFIILVEASIKNPKKYTFERLQQFSKINALLFTSLLSYLIYLFIKPDFTTDVVWKYTDNNAPFIFKISGIWAGQEGTYFLWAVFSVLFIYLYFSRSNKKLRDSGLFLRTAQLSAISSLLLLSMVIFSSPFNSIYDLDSDLPTFYVPHDGNSLNPALLNSLMVIHPPIIFIAYALLIIPFAASFCFFARNKKTDIVEWVGIVRPWLRTSWLFLTLSLSLGGLWSYVILGWGGFWSWDPVETSSFVPWLMITTVLHFLYRMNNNKQKFSIIAPALTIFSFILVLYSSFITRSSLWGSIHSFEAVTLSVSSKILLASMTLSILFLLYFIIKRLNDKKVILKFKKLLDSEIKLNMDTSFYIVGAILIILTLISLFGLTYPFIYELFSPQKLATSIEFYNLWSYVFLLPLVLFTGYGMLLSLPGYGKEKILKIVFILTLLFAFLRPADNLTLLDTSGLFYLTATPIYKLIGNISLLSIVPPLAYLLFAVTLRLKYLSKLYLSRKEKTKKATIIFVKKISVSIIHLSVFLIIFSLMFASYTTSFDTDLGKKQGSVSENPIFSNRWGTDDYSVILIDYNQETLIDKKEYPKYTEIKDIDSNPDAYTDTMIIYGLVTEVHNVASYSYIKITENNYNLWVATIKGDYRVGDYLIASGSLFYDFKSPTTGVVYDTIFFSEDTKLTKTNLKTYQEQMIFDIYRDGIKITENGFIETHNKYGGEVKVFIDRHILYDVYVIFNGSSDNKLYFSVKILPFINLMWFGVLLFVFAMTVILISERMLLQNKLKETKQSINIKPVSKPIRSTKIKLKSSSKKKTKPKPKPTKTKLRG